MISKPSLGFLAALLLLASSAWGQVTYTFDPPSPQPNQPFTINANWNCGGNFVQTQGYLSGPPQPGFSTTGELKVWFVQDNGLSFGPNPPEMATVLQVADGLPAGTYYVTISWVADPSSGCATAIQNLTLLVGGGSSGSSFGIGPGITGNWYDPAQSGHGFSIEVLPDNQLLAEWYVFGPNGGRDWIIGLGPITGNTAVLDAFQADGPGGFFPPHFNPAQVQTPAWGTMTFTFTDCNNGTVSWQPTVSGYTASSLTITRITQPDGLSCP